MKLTNLYFYIFIGFFAFTNASVGMTFKLKASKGKGACIVTLSPVGGKLLVSHFEGKSQSLDFKIEGTNPVSNAAASLFTRGIKNLPVTARINSAIGSVSKNTSLLGLLEFAAKEEGPNVNMQIKGEGLQAVVSLDLLLNHEQVRSFFSQTAYGMLKPYLESERLSLNIGPFAGKFIENNLSSAQSGEPFLVELDAKHSTEFSDPGALLAKFLPQSLAKLKGAMGNVSVSGLFNMFTGNAGVAPDNPIRLYRVEQQAEVFLDVPD